MPRVERISTIVSRPVLHVPYEFLRRARGPGKFRVDGPANAPNHFHVTSRIVATHEIGAADFALFDHGHERPTVIRHMQPVTDLLAVTIDRKLTLFYRIEDHQGNELFRKLPRP